MAPEKTKPDFKPVKRSLEDILGRDYIEALCQANAALSGARPAELRKRAQRRVEFYPASFQRRMASLLPKVGTRICKPRRWTSARGASSRAFDNATKVDSAPLVGDGLYRLGEAGRLHLTTKSEHYHTSLGHGFPGYALIDTARDLGVPNATHNNTRGHITRTLEERLVQTAGGLDFDDDEGLDRKLRSRSATVLNRVLNLETGSLAVEAAVKMILARFYRVQPDAPEPKYAGRTPVFIVMGNDDEGLPGNYHGTTVLTQMMRGMWAELLGALSERGLMRVEAVRPNRIEDLEAAFARNEKGRLKVAGFFHEIIMMNYAAVLLEPRFLKCAYRLCRDVDAMTVVDEIQSCLWSPEIFMYREYGLKPNVLAVGKGMPGGIYAGSRVIFNSTLDSLPQFGALVTNGQEELTSLAYLISMHWARANAEATRAVGEAFEARVRELAERHSGLVAAIEGARHMLGIGFHDVDVAQAFARRLNERGLDISVQTYKVECPPAALTKLPLTADRTVIDFVVDAMADALDGVAKG